MSNKRDKKTEPSKAKRTRIAPQKLAEILDHVNALPPDASTGLGVQDDLRAAIAIGKAGIEMNRKKALESYIVQLPNQVQAYIGLPHDMSDAIAYEEAKRLYDDLVNKRDFLRGIAKINKRILEKRGSYDEQFMLEYWKTQGIESLIDSRITLINWSLRRSRLPRSTPEVLD